MAADLPSRVVITGASSGLGRALALSYAGPGVTLGIVGRDPTRLASTAEACRSAGAAVDSAVLDVGEAEPLEAWLKAFEAAGGVDVVIANAGVSGSAQGPAQTDGLASAARQVRVNLLGAIHTIEPLAAGMITRQAGRIGLIASTAAYRGIPYMPAYAASKAGVRTYGEALRALLGPHGVSVTVATPGFFDSRMSARYLGPQPLKISTEAAAARVRRGLDQRRARVVFPQRIRLLLQMLDLLPGPMGDALLRTNRFRIEP